MNRHGLLLSLMFGLALVLSACGGGDSEPTPEPTATVPPTLPPIATMQPRPDATPVTAHPAGTRTGIEVIDRSIDAVESGDIAALQAALSFHPFRCDAPGPGSANPCPAGLAIGSAIDVIAAGACETTFTARDGGELTAMLQTFLQPESGSDGTEAPLYAVTEVAPNRILSPLPVRYLIVYADGRTLILDDGGVTHIGLPCESAGPADMFHPADRAILPPTQ